MNITGLKDTDREILTKLSGKDLLSLCQTNSYWQSLCDDKFFENYMKIHYPQLVLIKNKEKLHYNTFGEEKNYKSISWKMFYAIMMYYIGKIQEEFNIPYIPAPAYDPRETYIKNFKDPQNFYNRIFLYASYIGDIKLIKYLVEEQKIYKNYMDYGLNAAGYGGHLDVIKYLISKGAYDYYSAIIGAIGGNNKDIIKFLLDKIPNNSKNYTGMLLVSVLRNNIEIVDYIFENKRKFIDYSIIARSASRAATMEMFLKLIEYSDLQRLYENKILEQVIEYDEKEPVTIIEERVVKNTDLKLNKVKYITENVKNITKEDLERAVKLAIQKGETRVAEYLSFLF